MHPVNIISQSYFAVPCHELKLPFSCIKASEPVCFSLFFSGKIQDICVSSDGAYLCTIADDKSSKIFDVTNFGKILESFHNRNIKMRFIKCIKNWSVAHRECNSIKLIMLTKLVNLILCPVSAMKLQISSLPV